MIITKLPAVATLALLASGLSSGQVLQGQAFGIPRSEIKGASVIDGEIRLVDSRGGTVYVYTLSPPESASKFNEYSFLLEFGQLRPLSACLIDDYVYAYVLSQPQMTNSNAHPRPQSLIAYRLPLPTKAPDISYKEAEITLDKEFLGAFFTVTGDSMALGFGVKFGRVADNLFTSGPRKLAVEQWQQIASNAADPNLFNADTDKKLRGELRTQITAMLNGALESYGVSLYSSGIFGKAKLTPFEKYCVREFNGQPKEYFDSPAKAMKLHSLNRMLMDRLLGLSGEAVLFSGIVHEFLHGWTPDKAITKNLLTKEGQSLGGGFLDRPTPIFGSDAVFGIKVEGSGSTARLKLVVDGTEFDTSFLAGDLR